jgi:pimeloyl-ACP methyl ester carboxylesterase
MQEQTGRLDGRLAYAKLAGTQPGVVFLPGFRSDMQGSKALALREHCAATGRALLRFDYSGHGASEGRFEDGTIGQWAADAIAALDALTEGPQLLVGSSMGGWIALLMARARPERVAGLIGIAPAPDFTETLMWPAFTAAQRAEIMERGVLHLPSEYGEPTPITRALIEDGKRQNVLDAPIPLTCPVRCIVGGDGLCFSIAGASIIAKVLRDRAMRRLDPRWPAYGFARHAGYPTAAHREALARLGPSPHHRRGFGPVDQAVLKLT